MALYEVDIRVSTYKTLEIEADSADEAKEAAHKAYMLDTYEYSDATIFDEECDVLNASEQ